MLNLNSIALGLALGLPLAARGYDPLPPTFPLQQGWLGGDCAYSVPFGTNNQGLWLFGDTFVRNDSVLSRVGAAMVANTIAIRVSDGVTQTINYYWQHQGTAAPDAFFASGTSAWKYWPEDGFACNGALYVCLIRIQTTGSGPFDFGGIGVDLARVANPLDPPPNWRITYRPLSSSPSVFPGTSTVALDGYAYLFADADDARAKNNRPIYLARIPVASLDTNPGPSLEYLAAGNVWKSGPINPDAETIMRQGVTEMTVRWHPDLNRWVAVQISNEFPSHRIWRRLAPSLTGPWSPPVSIYSIPEYSRSNPGYGPDRFFYAGKEHIEFLNPTDGTGIITYAGNSFSARDVEHDLNLYVPEAVRLEIDPIPGGAQHRLPPDTKGAGLR